MTEKTSNYDNDSTDSGKTSNTELIYRYTESLLKSQSDSLNRLDTKISGFLAFTGVLVRFVGELSGQITVGGYICYSCTLLQFLAYVSLGASALILCLGLTSGLRGRVISPKALMEDKWYFADRSDISEYIISGWIDAEKEYKRLGFEKGRKLNIAVWLIAISIVSITLSALIKTIWGN